MNNTKSKFYPIYVTVDEAAFLLSLGRTSIYKNIAENNLTSVKFGRATRVTFASVIQFALASLKGSYDDIGTYEKSDQDCALESYEIAARMVECLYNIHSSFEPTVISDSNSPSQGDLKQLPIEFDENENTGEFV